jgi:nuclear RNA export factor
VSEQSRQVAVLFLQQYLSIYDSEDRQPLLDAYHDSAVLSMSVSFAPGQAATGAGRYRFAFLLTRSSVMNIYTVGWTHT